MIVQRHSSFPRLPAGSFRFCSPAGSLAFYFPNHKAGLEVYVSQKSRQRHHNAIFPSRFSLANNRIHCRGIIFGASACWHTGTMGWPGLSNPRFMPPWKPFSKFRVARHVSIFRTIYGGCITTILVGTPNCVRRDHCLKAPPHGPRRITEVGVITSVD